MLKHILVVLYIWGCFKTTFTRSPKRTTSRRTTSETKNCICGKVKTSLVKNMGVITAKDGAWPWQVAILKKGKFACGGTLISNQHVLTAADCLYFTEIPPEHSISEVVTIRMGSNDRTNTKNTNANVSKFVFEKDISLLTLSQPIKFTEKIKPICLPVNLLPDAKTNGFLTGWGKRIRLGKKYPDPNPATKLRQVFFKNLNDCLEEFCAGYINDCNTVLTRACSRGGDSGAPVQFKENDRFAQYGMIRFGSKYFEPKLSKMLFTRVTKYIRWIKQNAPGAQDTNCQ